MKQIVVNKNGGKSYSGNLLFRVYHNQEDIKNGEEDFTDKTYCFEILCATGTQHPMMGRYTSSHPQAAQEQMEKLLDHPESQDRIIELSNELINGFPHIDCNDKSWFDSAIEAVVSGTRKYAV